MKRHRAASAGSLEKYEMWCNVTVCKELKDQGDTMVFALLVRSRLTKLRTGGLWWYEALENHSRVHNDPKD